MRLVEMENGPKNDFGLLSYCESKDSCGVSTLPPDQSHCWLSDWLRPENSSEHVITRLQSVNQNKKRTLSREFVISAQPH